MFKNILIYIGIILLSIPTIIPLFHEGFFTMHDDAQVVRVQQMHKALSDGQFPVRWVADLGYGYGYPLFNFYGPLPYYVGAFIMFFGASSLVATKIMFGIGILGAALGMFLLARKIWGPFAGAFAAILYQYAPYHAVDIYVRGALSEFWAIASLPFVLWGIVFLEKSRDEKKFQISTIMPSFLIISLSYAALITTHNITAMITSILLAVGIFGSFSFVGLKYVLQKKIEKNVLNKTIVLTSALVFGLGLSAFFWLPAFTETSYTNVNSVIGGGADYPDHFLYLEQLWDSSWGFGGSVQGRADGMSFKIGKIHIILAVFSLMILVWQIWKKSANKRLIVYTVYIVAATLVSIFMTTSLSKALWDVFPLFAFIQYPWRFLVFVTLGISLLTGGLFTFKGRVFALPLLGFLLIMVIYVNTKYFAPQHYVILSPSVYSSDYYVKWWVSRISDEYMPSKFSKPRSPQDIVSEKFVFGQDIEIKNKIIKTDSYELHYNAVQDSSVRVNLAYFPGWRATVDDKDHPFLVKQNGIELTVPAGEHELNVMRRSTSIQIVSNLVSLFCFVAIFGTIIRFKYFHEQKK